MNSATNQLIQLFAVVLQVLNALNVSQLPPKAQVAVTGAITILQAVVGITAHYFTPAGNAISGVTGNVISSTGVMVGTVPTVKQ